jgi:hypothetical protein
MNSFTYDNPEQKVSVKNGVITIRTISGGAIYIREVALNKFEDFYHDWQAALSLIANDSFLEGLTNNQAAKGLLLSAMGYLGVSTEEFYLLTVAQLQILLLAHDGGPGIIFGMHNCFPKPLSSPAELKTVTQGYLKVFVSQLPLLIQFFQQESTYSEGLAVNILRKVGLYLASCTISVLKFILTYLMTLRSKKNSVTKNGSKE